MRYTVANSDDLGELLVLVNNLMAEFWIPQGGVAAVAVTFHDIENREVTSTRYLQAMVKHPGPLKRV